MLALTVKTKEEESALELVTPVPLLLPFKEVKGLSTKILRSLFLFRGKVSKAKGEDLESNKSTSSENVLITGSLQKRRAGKASKKSPKKKLKIGPTKPLASSKANRKKGKVAIITEADREVVVGKPLPKRKLKYSYYSKTLIKLIKALDSKKELEEGVLSIL